jgi:hypothetical protein
MLAGGPKVVTIILHGHKNSSTHGIDHRSGDGMQAESAAEPTDQ